MKEMHKYNPLKITAISFMLGLISVSQSNAFIGGPPITTYSIAMLLTNLGLLALSFSISVIFQGWYMSAQHVEIENLEAILQSLKAKTYFLLYALPILILSDIFGISLIILIDKIPILNSLGEYPWVLGILYFAVGLFIITVVVGKIETYLFTKKWPNVEVEHLRRTTKISNTVIFALALIIIVFSKEYMM